MKYALLALCMAGAGCDDGGGAAADDMGLVLLTDMSGGGGAGGEGGGGACNEGETTCGGACVDTRTDTAHCGGCGMACGEGESCVDAACVAPDPCARGPLETCDASDDAQPPPMNEHAAGYDDAHQMMIIFGGNTAVPENCGFPAYTFMARTWIYYDFDTGCGHWVEVEGEQPPGRARHAGTFGGGAFWVHGGRFRAAASGNYDVYDDLWRFDPETRTWTEVITEGPTPAGRFNHTLVWAEERNELLLFAGNTSGNALQMAPQNDVWAYSLANNRWRRLDQSGTLPSRRTWQEAIWDNQRQQMVIYGGGDESAFSNNATYFRDLLAFDPQAGTWSQLHNGNRGESPEGRFWSRMVYDQQNDQYIMFAGHDDQTLGNANDTWTFDPTTREWTAAAGADAFNRPANGFCDFPADFTTVAPGTPERRNAHTLVWSNVCGHALTFGGKTDCGAVNDVWAFGADGWSNPVMASEGEACLRWRSNPDNCANMCF